MLKFICDYHSVIELKNILNTDYSDLLKIECYFCIKIDNKIFYEQPLFPILEFIYFYTKWNKNSGEDFIYNTIESEENPMFSIKKTPEGWKLNSVWKKFDCNVTFAVEEITNAINDMIATLI